MVAKIETSAPRPEKPSYKSEDYVAHFAAVIRQLTGNSWFDAEGWRGRASLYTRVSPAVASMHVFKNHWFNGDGQGIHFETFAGEPEARKRVVVVTLHLLHTPTIPGTRLKRTELSRRVVGACFEMVSAWPGYRFKVGKYGVQPFALSLAFSDETELRIRLATEFARLCRNLGPVIDQALTELQG